ncbi:MAG TPA: hypothetical protein ENI66_01735 [Candidatus Yonathbacteria bacterium]|nr:hypothetical protein [Candidatus Yonathbacteria bacterium]
MVREPNISFIPKVSLAKSPRVEKRPVSLFTSIAVLVLILVGGAYGGIFYYTRVIENNIVAKQVKLEKFNEEFDKTIIQKAKSLENRINTVEGIISRHTALLPIFTLLERATLRSVQLTSFNYIEEEKEGLTITISGIAPGFASLAYQRDVFLTEITALKSFDITDFALEDTTGAVTFNAKAIVSPATVEYDNSSDTTEILDNNTGNSEVEIEESTSTSTNETISS